MNLVRNPSVMSCIMFKDVTQDVTLQPRCVFQMEKYSKHLEVLVAERTQDLMHEKQRTDRLLYSTTHTHTCVLIRVICKNTHNTRRSASSV